MTYGQARFLIIFTIYPYAFVQQMERIEVAKRMSLFWINRLTCAITIDKWMHQQFIILSEVRISA